MNTFILSRFRIGLLATLGLLACSAALGADEEEIIRAAAGYQDERTGNEKRNPGDLKDFVPAIYNVSSKRASLETVQQNSSLCCAFWVYDARTRLFDDFDGDGHFTYLRVTFDIDTSYFEADVYVRLFLRGSNGAWSLIYNSEEFSIFGSSGADEYEVETELVAGFPPDDYDVMIEVYEGVYSELVAEYGPANTSSLSYLPLEDISFDSRLSPPVVVSSGGGGAASLDMLILLVFAALAMQRGDGDKKPATRTADRIGPLCWSDDAISSTRLAPGNRRSYVVAGFLVPPVTNGGFAARSRPAGRRSRRD